jgi:peptidoglycan/xylan/chitin deacetylase (PgdA/CDA1 family)
VNLFRNKKFYFIASAALLAALLAFLVWLHGQYIVPVVMYHSIREASEEPLNNVTPKSFSRQMDYLKKNGYEVLSMEEYADRILAGSSFSRRSVVITFDDGFEDNYLNAFPVLREKGFPATIFVPSDKVGGEGRLSWGQIRDMLGHGITIASHLKKERYLPELSPQEQWEEISESRKDLEARLGRPVLFLAYPIGGFSESVKAMVSRAGYKLAFTTNRGHDGPKHDMYALKRIRIKDTDTDPLLWIKLSGYYNLLRRSRNPY